MQTLQQQCRVLSVVWHGMRMLLHYMVLLESMCVRSIRRGTLAATYPCVLVGVVGLWRDIMTRDIIQN